MYFVDFVSSRRRKLALALALAGLLTVSAPKPVEAFCCGDGVIAGGMSAAATIGTGIALAGFIVVLTIIVKMGFDANLGAHELNAKTIFNANAKALEEAASTQIRTNSMGQMSSKVLDARKSHFIGNTNNNGGMGLPDICRTTKGVRVSVPATAAALDRSVALSGELVDMRMKINNTDGWLLDSYKVAEGYRKQSGGAMYNADIRADSLLAPTYGNEEVAKAAQHYIMNVIDAMPPRQISKEQEKTAAGRKYVAMARAEQAKLSLPMRSFADAAASRVPVPGLRESLNLSGSTEISYRELFQKEVERRYGNGEDAKNWHKQIATATEANLMRENLLMQALSQRLNLETINRLEKIELLLAQIAINTYLSSPQRQQLEAQRDRVPGS